jgi:hypothetical protein
VAVLKDEGSDVREAAAWALGKIGDARAVMPLVTVTLAHEYRKEMPIAISALERILEGAAADAAPKDLRAVARLKKMVKIVYIGGDCGPGQETEMLVDCSHVNQLARQELIRRGLEV